LKEWIDVKSGMEALRVNINTLGGKPAGAVVNANRKAEPALDTLVPVESASLPRVGSTRH